MSERRSAKDRWARFRFSVVGELLAAPPKKGQLRQEWMRLSHKVWRHPITEKPFTVAPSTIERWFYRAHSSGDPITALERQGRRDRGLKRSMPAAIGRVVHEQYQAHPKWSYQLHYDNLVVALAEQPELGRLPSYSTVRRFMKVHDHVKLPRSHRASRSLREKRSFEVEYTNALWHLDFHHGSRKVLTPQGRWEAPILLAILDDHSRLVCHLQWYLQETTECLIHGLTQAFIKRGLPRSLLSDNGSAMIAEETIEGLARLSILKRTTLPASPYQNGKQEVFFSQVEARLMAMLEGQDEVDLELLNQATLAWIEMEVHRRVHRETGQTPLHRWLHSPSVARPCPELEDLRFAFTALQQRRVRKSDGTVSLMGTRYEIPSRYRHLGKVSLRLRSWDKTLVYLVDEHSGALLERIRPLDKLKNADGKRRPLETPTPLDSAPQSIGMAPLLRKLMAEYAATGLPPAYLPKETS